MEMLRKIKENVMLAGVLMLVCLIWETMPVSAAEMPAGSVSENSIPVTDEEMDSEEDIKNSMDADKIFQMEEIEDQKMLMPPEEDAGQEKEEPVLVSGDQFQTVNYRGDILTDWQPILEALKGLTPESLTDGGNGNGMLVLQLKNVGNIPSEVKECIVANEPGYTKLLQCSLGYGVSVVLNGAEDNSGFCGISNTHVSVGSEKRGKKSVATTVRFESHENIGAIVSLQVNLPQCSKGTKVSVYAETVAVDGEGNVTVGENACIGTTKAGENGNVEIPIQSTANYMFVYKEAKE